MRVNSSGVISAPSFLGRTSLPRDSDIDILNGKLFAHAPNGNLYVASLDNPTNFTLRGDVGSPSTPRGLHVVDGELYTQERAGRLRILRINNPESGTLSYTVVHNGTRIREPQGLAHDGTDWIISDADPDGHVYRGSRSSADSTFTRIRGTVASNWGGGVGLCTV